MLREFLRRALQRETEASRRTQRWLLGACARPRILYRLRAAEATRLLRGLRRMLCEDALGELARQLLQVVEAVAEGADAERHRAQLDDEIMQLGLRNIGGCSVPVRPVWLGVEAQDPPAPPGDKALHLGGEGGRHRNLDSVKR